jgi:hypothetical protein
MKSMKLDSQQFLDAVRVLEDLFAVVTYSVVHSHVDGSGAEIRASIKQLIRDGNLASNRSIEGYEHFTLVRSNV